MHPNSTPHNDQILRDFSPRFRFYKDGHIQRLRGQETISPGLDPLTGVQSKDLTINPETGLSVRMFLPDTAATGNKLPLLIYIHGGAFCTFSTFHPFYHRHLNTIADEANVVILSVNYRLAPEHPIPICYDDSWAAIQWAVAHSNGSGPEPWLNDHADFGRLYFAGDSAGGNISHKMAMQVGADGLAGLKLTGVVLIHPYFGSDQKDDNHELIAFLYPTMAGFDNPKINPVKDPNLKQLGCRRVLVMVAEKDYLRDQGRRYYEALKNNSGWEGQVDIEEAEGEDHVFHLVDPTKEKAQILVKQFVSFLTQK